MIRVTPHNEVAIYRYTQIQANWSVAPQDAGAKAGRHEATYITLQDAEETLGVCGAPQNSGANHDTAQPKQSTRKALETP